MKFGTTTIPQRLFDLARERLLGHPTSTPDDVRTHLLKQGLAELKRTNALPRNHLIIAERVFQTVRKELVESGEIAKFKHGVWATTKFLKAAEAAG